MGTKPLKMISMKHAQITNEGTLRSKNVLGTSPEPVCHVTLARLISFVEFGFLAWKKPHLAGSQVENKQLRGHKFPKYCILDTFEFSFEPLCMQAAVSPLDP